jgi:chromosome segregation ATPase
MTERKRNPEEILEDMLNKHVLFEKLEVATGVLAGAGTASILVMSKVPGIAFAAALPLTMAVALNYFNRLRIGQISRYQTHIEVAEVQRRLSSEIQGLKPLGSGEVSATSGSQVENAIASLAEKIAMLEASQGSGAAASVGSDQVSEELVQLRNHQLDLSQSLEAVNQQLRSLPVGASAEGVNLDALRQEFQGLLHPVQQNLVDLESRLTSQPVSGGQAPLDVEPLRAELSQMIAPVHQQLLSLEERLSTQVAAAPAGNSESLQAVHGQVHSLNEKLDSVAAQLAAEIAGFQQSVQQTQERMQTVHQQVEAVHQNVSAAPAAAGLNPEAVQHEVQSVVGPLREQLVALEQRLGGMPVADPHAAQLQAEQMVSLQNQLNSTNGAIEDMALHLTEHLTTELSKIPKMVETHVDHKVSQLQPAAPVDKKKDALSELDDILADINL